MRKFQSPTPNRKGEYEIHNVPERKVALMQARGWTEIVAERTQAPAQSAQQDKQGDDTRPLTESLQRRSVFDLSGNWMQKRAQVRDTLGLDSVPKNKDEARVLLEDAGYEVTEG